MQLSRALGGLSEMYLACGPGASHIVSINGGSLKVWNYADSLNNGLANMLLSSVEWCSTVLFLVIASAAVGQ